MNPPPQSFYTVYSELFRDLSEEDMEFQSMDDADAPPFGDSSSDYEQVSYLPQSIKQSVFLLVVGIKIMFVFVVLKLWILIL